ncbi:MAG: hypothetical protein EAZ26_06075, partial [Runella slithyformis]
MKTQPENTSNWFVDKLNLYQAANTDNESLKRNFVVRTHEFNIIIDDLRQKKGKDPLQHELVLGRRGSGKSTLLKRLQIAVEEDPKLSERYVAINLAEEQASIYRLSDLWYEVLQELSIKVQNTLQLRAFSSFANNQDYTRYLYAQIHELLQNNAKKAVLLLDNFDRILENLADDAHLLREILQNHNDLQIIGGSTRLDEHFWRYDKPFYEFFRRHRLEALTFDEIHQLLGHWSALLEVPQLKDYALQNRGKIEALRILTDGLPRTLQFFIQILLQDHNLYGYDYIKKVMDKATPIYQERLNSLSPAHRKIVLELAFLWEAASTKQLVDKCRMESKVLSSLLKQLYGYGIIEKIETSNKNHLYRIAERFFGMWLIVTQGNPDQKRKAKFLTIFLETWYDSHQLQDLASSYLTKLKNQEIGFDKAVWEAKTIDAENALQLSYVSKDGEEGFPGALTCTVLYKLTDEGALEITYTATTDKPTVVNLTNHTYFNLTGEAKNDILGHELTLNADRFLPVDAGLIPTGELRAVQGTPFDFTKSIKIGAGINNVQNEQIKLGGGYDHCWLINRPTQNTDSLVLAAI